MQTTLGDYLNGRVLTCVLEHYLRQKVVTAGEAKFGSLVLVVTNIYFDWLLRIEMPQEDFLFVLTDDLALIVIKRILKTMQMWKISSSFITFGIQYRRFSMEVKSFLILLILGLKTFLQNQLSRKVFSEFNESSLFEVMKK